MENDTIPKIQVSNADSFSIGYTLNYGDDRRDDTTPKIQISSEAGRAIGYTMTFRDDRLDDDEFRDLVVEILKKVGFEKRETI